ncbi:MULTISPECIES: NUDIX hydrolase [Chryseobacterium]|uniref:NUDIX hydrolase n=1 Tax=Chryseobacterium TaxID=59732 RepID=UPI000787FBA8|nr:MULTISPECIES: NUDIX domain-containing protein [Chryseobacterium]KYH07188.1 NUDIX hydrolase [Chryseobacterium cucumeris]MDH5033195.1 NUDIX domain-containing protein [Chryseobacterium cucumeris]QWT86807.1 NUDIX domain-containing protein [Chryseobacterium sp. PCH239]RKE81523.1 putative NUDIX family NTP pyrophosphohydrolase [Chryseobacterium sp. AG363]TXI96643.1 MAG: NUDIX domain-containing protein [Chryseobacterium cucumeris]
MKTSSGILLFKKEKDSLYYFLVHPGGPFWRNKDSGAWSIPKGEILPDEDPLVRALTEFKEETGKAAEGQFIELSPIRQKGGKTVYAWALEGDIDTSGLYSNSFPLEWPPKSGKIIEIPEVDQWEWFASEEAQKRINPAQKDLITELESILKNY